MTHIKPNETTLRKVDLKTLSLLKSPKNNLNRLEDINRNILQDNNAIYMFEMGDIKI